VSLRPKLGLFVAPECAALAALSGRGLFTLRHLLTRDCHPSISVKYGFDLICAPPAPAGRLRRPQACVRTRQAGASPGKSGRTGCTATARAATTWACPRRPPARGGWAPLPPQCSRPADVQGRDATMGRIPSFLKNKPCLAPFNAPAAHVRAYPGTLPTSAIPCQAHPLDDDRYDQRLTPSDRLLALRPLRPCS
jgi:hypothetical protein